LHQKGKADIAIANVTIIDVKLFDKADLQKILHDIEELVKKKSISNI